MCTSGHLCILIDVECTDSAMIIEFFWFLVALLTLVIIVLKCNKLDVIHELSEYPKIDTQDNIPVRPLSESELRRISEHAHLKEIPNGSALDAGNMIIDFDPSNQNQTIGVQNNNPTESSPLVTAERIRAIQHILDLMVNKHLVIFIIFIYLINNLASYAYTAVMVFFCITQLILFNYIRIFERNDKKLFQKYSELSYHFWIITLFMAYFIHDQSFSSLQ